MKPYSINGIDEFYFCTDTIVGWQYVFTSPEFFEVIIQSFKHCQREKGLNVHAYVIMPNHVHSILSAAKGNLAGIVRDFKRFTSRTITDLLVEAEKKRTLHYFREVARKAEKGNSFKVWKDGSHAEAIISDDFFLQKLNYIHENPVRKGYVDRPEHWTYSSARNYILNDQSIIQLQLLE